jgi:hypothetical protein
MTFTPALAAKMAEQAAAQLQDGIDYITKPWPQAHVDSLLRTANPAKVFALVDARKAARSAIRTSAENAKAIAGWIDRTDVHRTTPEQYEIMNVYPEYMQAVAFCAQDAGTLAVWERYKTVYAIDGDLLAELGETADETLVPAGLWQRLGHSDPYVALPEPLVLDTLDGQEQWIDGFWITGRLMLRENGYITTSTHAPGNRELGVLTHGRIMHKDGRPFMTPVGLPDANWTRITLADGVTVGEMVSRCLEGFTDQSVEIDWRSDVPIMLRKIVSVLVYLCSSNADMVPQPTPPRARKGKDGKRRPDAPRVIATGFRIGAAIKAYRSTPRGAERGEPTGRTVAPHIRRAHFQSFRVGPGRPNERTEVEVKWVAPIPVKMGDGKAAKPTIHEVKEAKSGETYLVRDGRKVELRQRG